MLFHFSAKKISHKAQKKQSFGEQTNKSTITNNNIQNVRFVNIAAHYWVFVNNSLKVQAINTLKHRLWKTCFSSTGTLQSIILFVRQWWRNCKASVTNIINNAVFLHKQYLGLSINWWTWNFTTTKNSKRSQLPPLQNTKYYIRCYTNYITTKLSKDPDFSSEKVLFFLKETRTLLTITMF